MNIKKQSIPLDGGKACRGNPCGCPFCARVCVKTRIPEHDHSLYFISIILLVTELLLLSIL